MAAHAARVLKRRVTADTRDACLVVGREGIHERAHVARRESAHDGGQRQYPCRHRRVHAPAAAGRRRSLVDGGRLHGAALSRLRHPNEERRAWVENGRARFDLVVVVVVVVVVVAVVANDCVAILAAVVDVAERLALLCDALKRRRRTAVGRMGVDVVRDVLGPAADGRMNE